MGIRGIPLSAYLYSFVATYTTNTPLTSSNTNSRVFHPAFKCSVFYHICSKKDMAIYNDYVIIIVTVVGGENNARGTNVFVAISFTIV